MNVCADDWTAERTMIASNDIIKQWWISQRAVHQLREGEPIYYMAKCLPKMKKRDREGQKQIARGII